MSTLNEKFYKTTGIYIMADECEKIADKLAIEFLKWVLSPETSDLIHRLDIAGEIDENITPEQLLEIYKKEKGL